MSNRGIGVAAVVAAAWVAAAPVRAEDGLRTLVVRGVASTAAGAPLAGARIAARGAERIAAQTDDEGRYSLIVPMGYAAGLAREPFTLEVRAEADGHRLPLASGGASLTIEVTLLPGAPARARVRTNSASATAAIAAAFARDGAGTAWVDADFGGGRAGGETRSEQIVALPGLDAGSSDARRLRSTLARDDARRARDSLAAAERAAAVAAKLAKARAADSLRSAREAWAAREQARRDSLSRAFAVRRHEDSLATARARADQAALAGARAAETRARRDSVALASAAKRRADSLAWVARRAAARPASPPARSAAAPRATRDVSASELPPPAATPAASGNRVHRIEAFAAPSAPAASESCACMVRGTIEVVWERPLEYGLPIDVDLVGPVRRRTHVELFMGSPREFRFGPLPCGAYRLVPWPHGRLHYDLARGDTSRTFECRGATEARLVLKPARR